MDISVIVPIFNVEKYLRQCLDSLKQQTFDGDLEFICINDGSTDNSLQIMREFETSDSRFVVVDKPNEGYGKTMNHGLDIAKGKYIAILESDDWAEPNMLKSLYDVVEEHKVDVVKGNYIQVTMDGKSPQYIYPDNVCNKIICATDYPSMLFGPLAIWTGLYSRDFLFDNNIRFNETPGASFQDTSFAFLVWLHAKKLFLIPDCLVNYRIQNNNSSVNSAGKVFCICDEFSRIEKILSENSVPQRIWQIETKMKYIKYSWNQKRLSKEMNNLFRPRMAKELFIADKCGYIDKTLYAANDQKKIETMLWSYARREYDEINLGECKRLIRQLPKAILAWYDFSKGAKALYIGSTDDVIYELLVEKELTVTCGRYEDQLDDVISNKTYDYIIIIGKSTNDFTTESYIKRILQSLSPNGKLLLGVHNPLGIRYLCGDHKPFENMVEPADIENSISSAGFFSINRYSVFPGLENSTHIFKDGYLPSEDLANRIIPSYWHASSVFEQEEQAYEILKRRGSLHQFANAYLYECSISNNGCNILCVTTNIERGENDASATIIFGDEHVEKKVLYKQGTKRLDNMFEYQKDLQAHGINVLPIHRKNAEVISMNYVNEPTGAEVIQSTLASGNVEGFLSLIDKFKDIIFSSSDIKEIEGVGHVLKHGYFDMIPLNSFYIDNSFLLFDQEFRMDNYTAEVILSRMITSIYHGHPELQKLYPKEEVYKRYGIFERRETYRRIAARDLAVIRNEAELREYHSRTRASVSVILENKARNAYGVREYKNIFEDIYANILTKKIYLFGSGKYAKLFLESFSSIADVQGIFDNSSDRWGDELDGIEIIPPNIIETLDMSSIKIYICIKDFETVLEQVFGMGVKDVAVYNPNRTYTLPKGLVNNEDIKHLGNMKYGVGYIAGVFDMFHIGHLNLIKRAKANCNYLIVGVCTDEWVRKVKKTEPIMSFEERLELVRSCKYVDEAVRIPPEAPTTWDAFSRYHFDVQFSGSDYENDPSWKKAKAYLEERGSTVVFFPYTESTSSTKLKEMINRRLI